MITVAARLNRETVVEGKVLRILEHGLCITLREARRVYEVLIEKTDTCDAYGYPVLFILTQDGYRALAMAYSDNLCCGLILEIPVIVGKIIQVHGRVDEVDGIMNLESQ